MSFSIRPYSPNDANAWDAFCQDTLQASLLHTRRFLSYHGDRFIDLSLIIENDGEWIGLLPAAMDPSDGACVTTHPGITYGGILHQGQCCGERMVEALGKISRYYHARGYARLLYKAVPNFYHQVPAQDDLYALFRLGAQRIRCDLSSTIDLQHRMPVSKRRRRSLNKAIKAGVEIAEGEQYLPDFWGVLTQNLADKHRAKPVHSLAEILLLVDRFPHFIRCVCAHMNGQVIAGIVLFITPTSHHAQYIAASDMGYQTSALDMVFEHAIKLAANDNKRWFDFGISNENQGKALNEGLYRFKNEFGGGGVVHEFYELDLAAVGESDAIK